MSDTEARAVPAWRGLGHWNLYFMGKLLLLWLGYLNLQPVPNLALAAFYCCRCRERGSVACDCCWPCPWHWHCSIRTAGCLPLPVCWPSPV
ncbi:cellulose biosynthesis protein BcsG [Oceanimonas sp. NS1]|nr:cellulose biosynthesis protein BcsG [Oceanimonas sp. NS1]